MKDKKHVERLLHHLGEKVDHSQPLHAHTFQYCKQMPLPQTAKEAQKLDGATIVLQKGVGLPAELLFEQRYCIPNQNYPLIYLAALKRRRFWTPGAKGRLIALRMLRLLSLELQRWIWARISYRICPIDQEHLPLHELIAKREERHLQVDRTIKQLSIF